AGPRLALPPVVLVVVHQVSQLQRLVIGESCAGHVQVLSDALSEPLLLVPIHASPRVLTGRESGAGTPPCDRVASSVNATASPGVCLRSPRMGRARGPAVCACPSWFMAPSCEVRAPLVLVLDSEPLK